MATRLEEIDKKNAITLRIKLIEENIKATNENIQNLMEKGDSVLLTKLIESRDLQLRERSLLLQLLGNNSAAQQAAPEYSELRPIHSAPQPARAATTHSRGGLSNSAPAAAAAPKPAGAPSLLHRRTSDEVREYVTRTNIERADEIAEFIRKVNEPAGKPPKGKSRRRRCTIL